MNKGSFPGGRLFSAACLRKERCGRQSNKARRRGGDDERASSSGHPQMSLWAKKPVIVALRLDLDQFRIDGVTIDGREFASTPACRYRSPPAAPPLPASFRKSEKVIAALRRCAEESNFRFVKLASHV
jgi:hypothetical protein